MTFDLHVCLEDMQTKDHISIFISFGAIFEHFPKVAQIEQIYHWIPLILSFKMV